MGNTVSSRIADRLRGEIAAGAFAPVGRFPTERELAERFAVARNTIRRAIDDLEGAGLVVRHVGRGTFVAEKDLVAGVSSGAKDPVEDQSDISPRDLIEARMMIEPAVAAAAAANATEADIALLQRAQDASHATEQMEEFERHDAEIHRLLFAMSQNQVLFRLDAMLCALRENADWLTAKRRAYSPEQKARYVAQHDAIIEAVRARSPKAAREAMTAHLEDVRRALLES